MIFWMAGENFGSTVQGLRYSRHIIEVQSGAYLGEDDILRVEDRYGRLEERDAPEATVTLSKPLNRRKADGDLTKVTGVNGKHAAP